MSILDLEAKRPTLSEVENAFRPARETDDPEKFAGRKDPVQQAYFGLLSEGAHLAIVGNRGIGKTSLARQVVNLASGDNELLHKLALLHDRKLDFLSVYLACGTSIKDVSDLLENLLTSKSCLAEWIYEVPKATTAVRNFKPKIGARALGLELSAAGELSTETSSERENVESSIAAIFTNVVTALVQESLAPDGLLIVIDEFDQIADPSGFASFLKALATNAPKVRFCIVGVSQDIHNLMKEHESSDRLFAGATISLPSMTEQELSEIVSIAERAVGKYITFTDDARELLISLAQGHPYMVHLIGKYAFRSAMHHDRRRIDREMVNDTMRSIAEKQYDTVLEGRYKKAVASSEQRESVLKALASTRAADGEIWTTNAYKTALELGVDNASQFVGQLVTAEYGGELEKLRDRFYRFHDSLFAAYVAARPRLVVRN